MGRRFAALAGIGSFMEGFQKGQQIGLKLAEARRDNDVRDQIGAVDQNFTPTETPAASGEDALAAGQSAKQTALTNALSEEDVAKVDAAYQPTIDALQAQRSTPSGVVQSMGIGDTFKQQDAPFSENDVQGAKAAARAGIYARSGREEDAARVLRNEASRRTLADDSELRAAMKPPPRTAAPLLASGATDLADTRADTPPTSASGPVPAEDPSTAVVRAQGVTGPLDRTAADAYLKLKAPAVIDTLLKQGNVEGAKRYRDFIDSEAGRNYTNAWSQGARKFAIGDAQGALNDFQTLYNTQLYGDGHTVKLTNLDGGQVQVDQFDKGGNKLGSKTMPIDALARQAGMALAPEKLVEFQAQQEAKRASEGASLDKGIELENLRQQGRDQQDDRRDERLGKRLDAQGAALERRLAAQADRGLTTAQERGNAEIDAARERIASMDPAEIQRRSAKATNTGRENKDYDPSIARAAALAGRRKIGNDDDFDARIGGQSKSTTPPAKAGAAKPIDAARAALKADPQMAGHTLGEQTVRGFKVFDANGRHVGYFGKAK